MENKFQSIFRYFLNKSLHTVSGSSCRKGTEYDAESVVISSSKTNKRNFAMQFAMFSMNYILYLGQTIQRILIINILFLNLILISKQLMILPLLLISLDSIIKLQNNNFLSIFKLPKRVRHISFQCKETAGFLRNSRVYLL